MIEVFRVIDNPGVDIGYISDLLESKNYTILDYNYSYYKVIHNSTLTNNTWRHRIHLSILIPNTHHEILLDMLLSEIHEND